MLSKTVKKASLLGAASSFVLTSLVACAPQAGLMPMAPGFNPLQPGRVNVLNQSRSGKKWTIAIYLAADNNLYSAGLDDINEMEAGLAKNPQAAELIDVIVLFDGLPKGDSKIYRIKPDANGYDQKIVSEVIDDRGAVIPLDTKEVDTGNPEVLNRFMDYVTRNHASEYNSFTIWNHGDGIFRGNPSQDPNQGGSSFFESVVGSEQRTQGLSSKAFASDDNGGELHLKDLNPALALATRNLGRPLDIFGFDTCLMQYVETAYQLKGQANILVASEELEPGDGWDYDAYLGALVKNPNMNPLQVSAMMVDTYGASYRPGGSQRGRDITLSALDINKMLSTLVPAINQLGVELQTALPSEKTAIDAARNATQSFYNRDSADLGDFVRQLSSRTQNPRLQAAVANIDQAIKQTVINETHYGAPARATGVQMYFPRANMGFNRRYDDVSQVNYAETRVWGDFLKAFTSR